MRHPCQKCACPCDLPANDYGELICKSCTDNAAEAAYDRHMESFHDGGATQWKTLQEQQIDLWGLK
jgi:hypothetical protein